MSAATLPDVVNVAMRFAPEGPIGVAVSGGGDSVALLLLMADWAGQDSRELKVVSVDHGLREEAAEEAAAVGELCGKMGLGHTVLAWRGWDGAGNLQDAARQARRRLIGAWAEKSGVSAVALGHTKDDQAETFLMRLARGSGVDGLAAMHPLETHEGLLWLRPLLQVSRQALRELLHSRGVGWADDPSNDDTAFKRVRVRRAMPGLAEIGLTPDVLADTAERLQNSRRALEEATLHFAQKVAKPRHSGVVRLDAEAFLAGSEELQLRLLAHVLKWVSASVYRPRFNALKRVLDGLHESEVATLSGCIIGFVTPGQIEIGRELVAIQPTDCFQDLFDGRWRISGPDTEKDTVIRALGEDGILQRRDWRNAAETRNTILSSPSIWYNNELMSAPLLDKDGVWTCRLELGVHDFFTSIVTH